MYHRTLQKSNQAGSPDVMDNNAAAREDDNDSSGSGATWWEQNWPKNIDMVALDNGTDAFFDNNTGTFVPDNGKSIYDDILGFRLLPPLVPPPNNDSSNAQSDKHNKQPSSRSTKEGTASQNQSQNKSQLTEHIDKD